MVGLGNTLVSKYAAAGALQDLTGSRDQFENNQAWLQSLTESWHPGGQARLRPLPGRQPGGHLPQVHVREGRHLPASGQPGGNLQAAADKLMQTFGSDKRFSAFYFPGKYWYAALPFVWDHGGDIAIQDGGQWRGTLDSAEAQAGLTELKQLVDCCSRADKQGDELKQDQAFAQGHIAMIVANGWEKGVILDPKQGNLKLEKDLAAFPPSRTSGQTAPVFPGGSDLGVAAKSKNQDLALDWVKLLAGNNFQTQMATVGGVIPNATTLLDLHADDPYLSVFDATAKNSRFTPTSPNWANVEMANVLPDMLVSIFTERASIADANKEASTRITDVLNSGSWRDQPGGAPGDRPRRARHRLAGGAGWPRWFPTPCSPRPCCWRRSSASRCTGWSPLLPAVRAEGASSPAMAPGSAWRTTARSSATRSSGRWWPGRWCSPPSAWG